MHSIILETQRTYLRQICLEDFNEIFAILGDQDVMYAWEHAFSATDVRSWMNENILRYNRDGYSYWAVILKNTEKMIGLCGIFKEEADRQAYVGLGYIFHKAFWGQGFAFECANACKNFAFHSLQIPLLTAQIRPDNTPSQKIAEKLGMAVIKHFDRFYKGKHVPHLLFGCSQ